MNYSEIIVLYTVSHTVYDAATYSLYKEPIPLQSFEVLVRDINAPTHAFKRYFIAPFFRQ